MDVARIARSTGKWMLIGIAGYLAATLMFGVVLFFLLGDMG